MSLAVIPAGGPGDGAKASYLKLKSLAPGLDAVDDICGLSDWQYEIE